MEERDRQMIQRNAYRKALRRIIRIHDVMSGAGLRPAIDGVRERDMVGLRDFETIRL